MSGLTYSILPHLGLPEKTEEDMDYEKLFLFILPRVKELLDRDLSGLLNVLYRLDVSEERFKEVLVKGNPEHLSEEVSRLIVDREKERLYYRKKYS